jgi:hypothetical protein
MATNAHIELPLHVDPDHIQEVVGRLAGAECTRQLLEGRNTSFLKEDEEVGEDVSWCVRVDGLGWRFIDNMGPTLVHMAFKDASGHRHSWGLHRLNEEEDAQLLMPGSHALAVAVGKRLIAFFGGTLTYDDNKGTVDETVLVRKAILPPRKKTQDSDDRFTQYQQALWSLAPLTSPELREAAPLSAYGLDEHDDALMVALDGLEASRTRKLLAKNLGETPKATTRTKLRV